MARAVAGSSPEMSPPISQRNYVGIGRKRKLRQRSIASSPQGKLCDRCKNVDFQAIFDTSQPIPRLNGLPVLDLENFFVECSVCFLFARFRYQGSSLRRHHHLRAFSSRSILGERRVKGQRPSVVLSVVEGTARRRWLFPSERKQCAQNGFIIPAASSPTPPTPRTFFEGLQVNPSTVNYKRIGEWLASCQGLHPNSCGSKRADLPIPLNCIDCETRKIVQIDMSDEYIALSYVWGAPKSNEHPRRMTGVLPSNVARVVQDALVVVLALGKRYLWVDKYCVEQRDHAIKRIQIQNMDQVYEGAHATIIACAGSDASFGLPGVSGVMRYRQPSAEIENLLLLSSLPPLSSALADSTWITRGWTYQEAIVSRRCLFFTPWQVYFVCRFMSCSEAVVNGSSGRVERPQKTATTLSAADVFRLQKQNESFRPQKSPEFRELADHITAYTSRRLTYQDDALNAFRGVLKRSPFPTYFGIPIAPGDASEIVEGAKALNIGFARGLYWLPLCRGDHRIGLSRCSKFPSWSWVGWKGSVEYCQKTGPLYGVGEGGFMEVERGSFDTAFWVEDTDRKPHSLKDLLKSTHGTKIIPELSNYLIINAQVFQFGFKPGAYGRLVCSTSDGLPPAKDAFLEPIFCQKPTEEMYQRLITESWDCVLLFKSIDSSSELYNLMIVEWIGDVAQRIGTITVTDSSGTFSRSSRKRQRVRIA